MKRRPIFLVIFFLLLVFILVIGCSGSKGLRTVEGDPGILYKQGLVLFNKGDYAEALTKFEEVKTNFPDSPPYTTWAELKVADCHFMNEEFVEAVASYEEFKRAHPTHEEMPYVQYQIGMSHFNQMQSLDRDQTPTRRALSSFDYLVANYPPSLLTGKAKEKMEACKIRLAEYEFYIGHYYYKDKKYLAASRRFEGVLEQFPKMSQEDKTLFFLAKSYVELNEAGKAQQTFMRLVTEYPKSSYHKEAREILDQGIKSKSSIITVNVREPQPVDPLGTGRIDVALAKFEDEERDALSLTQERKGLSKTKAPEEKKEMVFDFGEPKPGLSKKEVVPEKKNQAGIVPQSIEKKGSSGEGVKISLPPDEDRRKPLPPDTVPKVEPRPASSPDPNPKEEEKEKKPLGVLEGLGEEKAIDTGQPIDITSDSVESYTKDNLIVFRGNVTARQKDIVIYADSIEAVIIEHGKGIEKVVADGNVKVQQGIRVANCQKAIFYNLDKKVVLTGNPKLWEGENMVSGEEIVFDIERNRVDVKGGPGGRGKVKIQP
jgi:outer membrane protein assembly factor BamD